MPEPQPATLTVHRHAARRLTKLDRAVKARFADFQAKFCADHRQPGLRLKQLKGGKNLWSARLSADYRAILTQIRGAHFLLIDVSPRQSSYEGIADRYDTAVNQVTGAVEVTDFDALERVLAESAPQAEAASGRQAAPAGLFEKVSDEQLLELGVIAPLLPAVRGLADEDQLGEFCKEISELTGDVLCALAAGYNIEQIEKDIIEPVRTPAPVDPDDLAAAIDRPASMVTSSDAAVAAMLDGDFEEWRLWPHPTQRKIIDQTYRGPARVSGGPGTGKTVVALHRTARLARALDSGGEERILLTTFTRNLAADLKHKLARLVGEDAMRRVDVEHVDSLVHRLGSEHGECEGRLADDRELRRRWEDVAADSEFDAAFLHDEWTDVICAQLLTGRAEYFQARRVRRPLRLNRLQRSQVWAAVQRFNQRMAEDGAWSWPGLRMAAALAEEARADKRYRHVVVDEAQDLTPAHWRLLRAITDEAPDDMFIAGDTFQRIYGQPLTLGRLGVNIRGRSKRLTLNYRTTREILNAALAIAEGAEADDMDGDRDSLAGYRSVMTGASPRLRGYPDTEAELAAIAEQARAWSEDGAPGAVAIAVPTNGMAELVLERLRGEGVEARALKPDAEADDAPVHVGTMHRLKGLEYRYILIGGIGAEHFPWPYLRKLAATEPERHRLETDKARNLLFVAATRARDELVLTWTGEPTPLLGRSAVR